MQVIYNIRIIFFAIQLYFNTKIRRAVSISVTNQPGNGPGRRVRNLLFKQGIDPPAEKR